MRIVELEASNWKTALDFLAALKSALNAPGWCGDSPAAIEELMVWGLGPEVLQPPYIVRISGAANAPREVRDYIDLIADCVHQARIECKENNAEDVDVRIEY